MNSEKFWAAFEDEMSKMAVGIGSPVGSTHMPSYKHLFEANSRKATTDALPAKSFIPAVFSRVMEGRAQSPSLGRVLLAKTKGSVAEQNQIAREDARRKRGVDPSWKPGQTAKFKAHKLSENAAMHSPAAVEAARKSTRKMPVFSKIPGTEKEVEATKARKMSNFDLWMADKKSRWGAQHHE